MAHFNAEIAALVAEFNMKIAPGFGVGTVNSLGGFNVTETIALQTGQPGLQVDLQIRRNHDEMITKVKVVQPHLVDLIQETKETLETFEKLIAEGVLDGPQANIQLNVL